MMNEMEERMNNRMNEMEERIIKRMNEVEERMKKDACALQISVQHLTAIRMNRFSWSIGQTRLVEVPSDVDPPRANIDDLNPLETPQDIKDLGREALRRWLQYYGIFDDTHSEVLQRRHLLHFLGGNRLVPLFF